jgi:hypothetical protein
MYSAAYGAISYKFKGYCTKASGNPDNICYNSYR